MRMISSGLVLLPTLAASAIALSGCGLITKAFEGKARFSFGIDSKDPTYNKVELFNPDSDDDVRNNRDKIKSGIIKAITLEVQDIKPTNGAKYVGGQVDVKRSIDADSTFITAAGRWDGVPLYDEKGAPAIGQVINLDLPQETLTKLKDLIFKTPGGGAGGTDCTPCKDSRDATGAASPKTCPAACLDFRINGLGYDYSLQGSQFVQIPKGPVQISGEVVVQLRVTAGG
jgi:hypothetical protein